jgi:site-specific DNA-methyltransferase (adenine-specific)
MNFKKVLISELKPAAYNPRKNLSDKDPEYQRIKRSIEEFGYVDPVIVNADYTVIGGHQRLKVLKEMGEASIDVVVVDLPKNQEKALNVALNKISGDWDFSQLSIVLSELKEADFDISITGFSEDELKKIDEELFGEKVTLDTEPQISRAEELRKEWGTETGQLWQCGEHRIIVGDCTDPEVVARVGGATLTCCLPIPRTAYQ